MGINTWILIAAVSLFFHERMVSGVKNSICRCEKYAYDDKPFVAIWNSPTIGCDFNFSSPIDLKNHGILENDRQTWDGNRVSVFASAQLGLYPYFIKDGQGNYNGGLPQLVNLDEHLRKARMDIINKIPDPNYNGLAVIDWEAWRPIWDTNWNTKRIYKVRSVELVRSQHPTWTLNRLIEQAKTQFEDSARAMFEHTISLGKEIRPKAHWGFYGFPDCFANQENRYQCTPEVKKFNDRLEWLYSSSTALYPSMYLLEEHPDNKDYVLGRIRETLRFATKGVGKTRRNIPIFAYHRNIYENYPESFNFLSKGDLDNTVGLAADVGAAGIVLWGNRFDENTSPEVCEKINSYVANTLGPYLKNKVKQIESCSTAKCGHRGHCIQRSILTPNLMKKYEDRQRIDSCAGPVSLLHDGNVLLSKKSQVPEFPLANTSIQNTQNITQNNTTQIFSTNTEQSGPTGYNIDLGSQHGFAEHNTDKIVNPHNATKTNITKSQHEERGQIVNKTKNHTSNPHHNITQIHGDTTHLHSNQTHPLGNLTTHHGNNTNMRVRGKVPKPVEKKSSIPHPGKMQQREKNVMDQKNSKLVHELLSSVQGSLITTPEILKKHNITNLGHHANNSRKSNIMKTPDSNSPAMSSQKARKSWLPHMYVILIGVSLGGAVMFSVIFVAVYYYISLRDTFPSKYGEGKLFTDEEKATTHMPPKAHSSPKGSEIIKEVGGTETREKRKERVSNREKKIEINESSDKRKRVRSVDRSSYNATEEAEKSKIKRIETTDTGLKRSIPRARSFERNTKENERSRSKQRSRIPESTRSRSVKRDKSINRGRSSDDETSEYEVNIHELR